MLPKKVALKEVAEGKYSLDVRGYSCPYPEVFARRAMESLKPGNVFEITLDNAPSCETIPAAAEELKNKVLGVTKLDDMTWKIVIKKS